MLKPTDEESQDAPPPSVTCHTVKVALKGFEDFNIELIALVQNPESPSPKMKATQWNSRVRRSSGNGPPASRREALVAVRCSAPQSSHVFCGW